MEPFHTSAQRLSSSIQMCFQKILSPYIENVARELYARNIIKNKGQISHDGRPQEMATKKKHWEAIIRYIATLIQPREEPYEQSEILVVSITLHQTQANLSIPLVPQFLSRIWS
ncbi:hypothetical protein BCR33DRAFT_508592 [Rhizoclosmatium globosum]|uniref:Uncharacterized protein n=1 Tax=Rhizoclosmatium globosum TaxID=329046 RepID=A0A1Y2BIX4_9FUNG|nr:hypothetical protein BCR33DRAFT_508592 [Rhizoclosmatium globosum]|eukprot:ORY34540.1 hypothetical protein BCR33DRAFT_508592 [Rhizoclosmatium globosum]